MQNDAIHNLDITECAAQYGQRCQKVGMERKDVQRLGVALSNPWFDLAHHALLDELSCGPVIERATRKTIKLGTQKSAEALAKALVEGDFNIRDGHREGACDILKRVTISKEEWEINLAILTVGELGFSHSATLSHIYAKALSYKLGLCPAEVGPQLRLQYPDQPMYEDLLVAMDPITDSEGTPRIFSVSHNKDEGLSLGNAVGCLSKSEWHRDFGVVLWCS